MPRKQRPEPSESSESEAASSPEVSETSEKAPVKKTKRSFNGVDPERGIRHGRYRAKDSHVAATKCYGKRCQALDAQGIPVPNKMNIYVVETTRDSGRKVYGYVARRRPIGGKPTVVPRYHKELIPSIDEDGNPALGEDGNPILGENGKPLTDKKGKALMIRIPYLNKNDLPDQVIKWKEEVTDKKGNTKVIRHKEVITRRAGEIKRTVHRYRSDLRALKEIPDEVYEIANPPRGRKKDEDEDSVSEHSETASERKAKAKKKSKKTQAAEKEASESVSEHSEQAVERKAKKSKSKSRR